MVPTTSSVGALTTVKRDGVPIPTTTQTIKGDEYAFFDATAGSYEATYAVDNTAPAISNVSASAPGDGTASVTWDTNEASDSRVDYGTSPGSLDSHQSSPGLTTSHSVQLTGLAPNTTFYYRVVSTDAATNSATDPNPPAAPRSFTTPSASFTDTTVSDFGAGTPDANTYISEMSNGEVILKPAEGQEFSGGPGLPAGWGSQTWESQGGGAGGSATVSGGALHVDGAFAGTNATFGAGHSLDFEATFGAASFQHVAFTDNFNSAWAMFSTRGSNNQLFTSTNTGGGATDTPIGGQYIGSAHKYRIQWDAGQVQYYVDGTLVHTDNATFGSNLNVAASDFNSGGPGLSVNWLHLSPYPSSGTFTSRVFDAGQAADWGAMSWHANAPPGTSLAMSVRTGNTPTPDGSWSAFTPVTSSGDDVPGNSRYVQYRAGLGSSDPNQAPALSDVSIAYGTGTDTTAPTITQRTPAPGATNVPRNTNVDVQFSEAMNPATIDSSTVRLRKQGAGSDVPANVTYVGNTATIDPNADLDPSAVYNVTVAGTVTDANGNQLGADDTWSFTTASLSFIDTTVSDFSAGTPGRQHLRLPDERWRGHPEADRRRGVLRELGPGRLDELPMDNLRAALSARGHGFGWRPARQRRLRAHRHRLPRGPFTRVRCHLQRRPIRDGRLCHRPERPAVGDLQHQGRWQHALHAHRQRTVRGPAGDGVGVQSARQSAPLPDRVGRRRRQVLRGRRPGRDPHRQLPSEHARDRQRVQLRRP